MGNRNIRIDITGKVFGYLSVVRELPKSKKCETAKWECLCVCGNLTNKTSGALRRGIKISCGCIWNGYKHGLSSEKFYMKWLCIKNRCNNPKNKDYESYGGRGIKMCSEWESDYWAFHEWCSKNLKEGLSIDRIDNDKDYSPDNCKYSTSEEQCNNRRSSVYFEYNGERKTIPQWASTMGLKEITLRKRIDKGWGIEKALTKIVEYVY